MSFCVTESEIDGEFFMTEEEFDRREGEALKLLNSVELQNELIDSLLPLPEEFLPPFLKKRYAIAAVDEWPNAQGEFGRTPTNPILVNETWGEITYLSRLMTADNQRMIFHRFGSIEGAIDAFELVSVDGKFYDRLFVDMHHRHCSKKAPIGYTLLDELDGITGTSEGLFDFPNKIKIPLLETAINKFGAPIVSLEILHFNAEEAMKTINAERG